MGRIYLFIFTFSLGPDLLSQILNRDVKGNTLVYSTLSRVPETRIINGDLAGTREFPYQAYLSFNTSSGISHCGGALISKNYILTAAHCADNVLPNSEVYVALGAFNIAKNEPYRRLELLAKNYTPHEYYSNSIVPVNDLMLVKLPFEITETEYIRVIQVTTDVYNTYDGIWATVTGWGNTDINDTRNTDILHYAANTILSNEKCAKLLPLGSVIQDRLMCLSGNGSTNHRFYQDTNTCNEDSGGPLVVSSDILVGINSFSVNCKPGAPAVFVRLTKYLDWIADHIQVEVDVV